MKIHCKFCGKEFSSPGAQETTYGLAFESLTKHMIGKHREAAEELHTLIMLFSSYLLIKECARISPDETAVLKAHAEAEETILRIFGIGEPAA